MAALGDFQEARRKAALEDIKARLTGRSDDLLSYAETVEALQAEGSTRQGLQDIALDAIVGSVGRYADFTRSFLPRRSADKERWANLKIKALYRGGWPPIEVYKIGDAYFVLDGNHRVSVARSLGASHIQAYVTEVHTRVPLTADVQPDDLIIKARYAEFLGRTSLHETHPEADLTVTAPGQYRVLEEQIDLHRELPEQNEGQEASIAEAASRWYEDVYLPVVQIIREQDVLADFPGRTETDLYVWVAAHRLSLEEELGWQVRPEAAASDLVASYSPRLERIMARLGERLLDAVTPRRLDPGPRPGQWRRQHDLAIARTERGLFPDILVPLSGSERSWLALDQALIVARREESELHGFHVVRSRADLDSQRARGVQEEFDRRCQAAGVEGKLVIEAGPVARTICQRARWTDLVIANLAHPPEAQPMRRLGSGFRLLIRRCSRPILAVPQVSALSRALLAYDGSAKSREALYVATYLAGHWRIPLVVLTVLESQRTSSDTVLDARTYLEDHEVGATYVEAEGPVANTILRTAAQQQCDCLILGGYGFSPVLEVMLGSAVDQLLRESQQPLLICR